MKPWLLAIVMVVLLTTVNCSLLSDTVDEPAFYTGLEVLTGHQDTIETIRVDDRRDLLFSGSRDGTIKVWKVGSSMLLRSLLVSHLPAGRFAVHPTLPHIAALEVLGPSSSRLTVWNWERGVKLYTIALPDDPLYFAYSPRGTYLVMCRADWESLSLYRARDGRRLSMLDDGFGIVSYFTVSESENNIMTYQPSGTITYWRLSTGATIKKVDTLPNLSSIVITHDKRHMLAHHRDRLVVVDLLTGALEASVPLPKMSGLTVSPNDDLVVCMVQREEGIGLESFGFTGSRLYSRSGFLQQQPHSVGRISAIALHERDLVIGDGGGNLWVQNAAGELRRFAQNNLLEITGLSVRDDVIALASRGSLLTFSLVTNRFTRNVEEVIKSYRFERYANPLSSRTGLTFIDNSALLLWDKEETNRGIVSYNLDYALSGRQVRGLSSPPVQVTVLEDRLIVLEASGLLKILDRDDFETEFEYQSAGLKKAIAVDDRTVVGAGSRTVLFRSSLIRINSNTGETVPIQDSSLLVYDLAYDPDRDRLYTLSVGSADGSGTFTGVHVRSGRSQGNPETLMQFDGEDLSASIALAGDQLYSSVGYSQVRFWSEGRVQTLQRTRHIPRELTVSGRLLISLNRDSTLTIWDRRSRQVLADLYIFKDYSWIAVFPNENAYISRGADGYLILPQ